MNETKEGKDSDYSFTPPIILYDKECHLCIRFMESFQRIPETNKYSFIPIQDENIFSTYPQLNQEECFETLHLIDKDEKIWKGGEAISLLIEQFPLVSKFKWLIEKDMGKKTVKIFYDVVNKYRKAIKRSCPKCGKPRLSP
jgi:Uncharacterized protein conserved in bacteria